MEQFHEGKQREIGIQIAVDGKLSENASHLNASILPAGLLTGQKRIVGSLIGTRDDMDAMFRFAADHGIRSMVERHPLSAVNEVLGKLRDGKVRLRAVLTPD